MKLISFETAKLIKEKGFAEGSPIGYTGKGFLEKPYFGTIFHNTDYENNIEYETPTQSFLQTWLRNKHDIYVSVLPEFKFKKHHDDKLVYSYAISSEKNNYQGYDDNLDEWLGLNKTKKKNITYHICNTYEEALEEGLVEALKLI